MVKLVCANWCVDDSCDVHYLKMWGSHSRTHLGYEYMWKPRAQTDSSMWLLNWPSVFQFSLCAYVRDVYMCRHIAYVHVYLCCVFVLLFVVLFKHSTAANGIFIYWNSNRIYAALALRMASQNDIITIIFVVVGFFFFFLSLDYVLVFLLVELSPCFVAVDF